MLLKSDHLSSSAIPPRSGTTSIDIRAPTLNDLFAPTSSTSIGYFDLLTNFAGTGTQQVTQGNPNLVPEVARTYTAGRAEAHIAIIDPAEVC